ncbi:MAG: hypothetical protein H8E25_03095 [Planctomycetes bacterium]|nr:hypothetical protein [Planctomycetota bacterium]
MAEYTGPDRRQQPTPFLSRYSFFGGKRGEGGSPESSYYDFYPLWTWIVLTSFLMLNLLDAHFTLIYLQRGGEEANPIAVQLLASGMWAFIGVKAFGVGLGAVIFCILNDFKNARIGVFAALLFYQLLLLYHISLYLGWVGNVSS